MAAAVVQSPVDATFTRNMTKSPSPRDKYARTPSTSSSSSSRRKQSRQASQDTERLPTNDEMFASALIPLFDAQNQGMQFQNLVPKEGRHLVIWVRHFFCGMCQDYLRALSASISASYLESLPRPTSITVIGCGSPDLIPDYATFSGNCPYPIYADNDRKTYQVFGMENSLSLGPSSPEYQTSSLMHIIVRGIWQGITSGSLAVKGGKSSQLGGEMLFEDGKVVWCHRMQNTRDHTSPEIIKALLEL